MSASRPMAPAAVTGWARCTVVAWRRQRVRPLRKSSGRDPWSAGSVARRCADCRRGTGGVLYLTVLGLLGLGAIIRSSRRRERRTTRPAFVPPILLQLLRCYWQNTVGSYTPIDAGSQIFIVHPHVGSLVAWTGFGLFWLYCSSRPHNCSAADQPPATPSRSRNLADFQNDLAVAIAEGTDSQSVDRDGRRRNRPCTVDHCGHGSYRAMRCALGSGSAQPRPLGRPCGSTDRPSVRTPLCSTVLPSPPPRLISNPDNPQSDSPSRRARSHTLSGGWIRCCWPAPR
jgi:hypothetical protein